MDLHSSNTNRDDLGHDLGDRIKRRRTRPRPRSRPRPPPRRIRAASAAALSCSLVLAAGGSAALSSLGSLGLVSGFGVLAESAAGGEGGGQSQSESVEASKSTGVTEQQQQKQQRRAEEILKPLVLDDFATVVHVTEPILQTEEQQQEEGQQVESTKDDLEGGGIVADGAEGERDGNDPVPNDNAENADEPQKQQPQQPKETTATASEVLHDDSLASIPPLPSDLIQLAEGSREDLAEEKEMARDALDSKLGEYDHGHEEALAEAKVGADADFDGSTDDVDEEPDDSGASDEISNKVPEDGASAEQQQQDDGSEEPLASESPVDDIDSSQEQPSDSTVDPPKDGTGTEAEKADATDDSPKNRVVVDYASKAAGALVLEKSPNLKGTSNLLNNDNDKYAIAPCDEERKYVVIGLSEDILVKQIVLANYERYSSHPKEFQVLGSQTYPDATWIDLGTYTAQPGNRAQTFDLIDPTWARYLKLRFITHYGSEHYCTVSQIKVHGSTMLQGFHEQWKETEEEVKKVIEAVEGDEEDNLVEEDDDGEELEEDGEETNVETEDDSVDTDTEDDANESIDQNLDVTAASSDVENDKNDEKDAASDTLEHAEEKTDAQDITPPDITTAKEVEASNSDDETKADGGPDALDASPTTAQMNENNVQQQDMALASEDANKSEEGEAKISDNIVDAASDGANTETEGLRQEVMQKGSTPSKPMQKDESDAITSVPSSGSGSVAEKPDEVSSFDFTPSSDGKETGDNSICIPFQYGSAPTMCADLNISEMSADSFVAAMNNFNRSQSALSLTSIARESVDSTMSDGTVASMIGNLSSLASVSDAFIRSSIDKASSVIRGVKDDSSSVISTKNKMEDTGRAGSHHAILDMIDDSAFQQQKKAKSPKATKTIVEKEKESGKKTPPKKQEESLVPGAMDAEIFAALAGKYPAASCLKDLNYQEFKTKIIEARAKKKPAVVEKANGPPQPGKIEPIFKTLTDEIKSLQLSQSVYDQYIKAVTSCYQRIILDVTNELKTSESVQAERLSLLEDAIRDLQSQNRGHSAIESIVLPFLALVWFAGSSILGAMANLFQPQTWFVAAEAVSGSYLLTSSDCVAGLTGVALALFLVISFIRRKAQRRMIQPWPETKSGSRRRSRSAPDLLA